MMREAHPVEVKSVLAGISLLVTGLLLVSLALPATHRLVRLLRQERLTRGDIDLLGSSTFLMASVGLMMAITGLVVVIIPWLRS